MRYLAVQKIPVISMNQFLEFRKTGKGLPPRSVLITIDDGYKTAKTIAWPILKRFGFPFTEYIYPQAISRHGNSLTWNEVRAMDKAGVDFGSHTMTHPLLTHPPRGMTTAEYRKWLDHELVDSKTEIESQLGHPVRTLAYSFGGYDERVVEHTRAAGYEAAFTCDSGNVTSATEPLHLNRFVILRQTKPRTFVGYLSQGTLEVDQQSPRDGERLSHIPKEVVARITNLSQILPGSASILIDKVGSKSVPVKVDEKTGMFRVPLAPNLKKGYFFISLVARDRIHPESRREASWLFIVKGK